MDLIFVALFLLTLTQIHGEIVSPCPKYFVFEPNKSEDDRWYGIITLHSATGIKGINLELQFDKSLIQLGNWLGQVKSDSENVKFTISNAQKEIAAGKSVKVEIYAVYDPYFDVEPPKLLKIRLNGREICPDYHEEGSTAPNFNTPTLLVNINIPRCGTTIATATGLITEGQYTTPGQWPWHAALYRKEGNERKYMCGGSLISEQHVLTAAHCTTLPTTTRNPQDLVVILGKHGLWFKGKNEQTFNVAKIVVHQNFNRTNFYNDISILYLDTATKYTKFVRPICLWDQNIDLASVVDKVGTAVGWGRDHNNNPTTDLLMMAHMPVVDNLKCIYSHPEFYGLFTNDQNFCAGYRNGTSVCNGDSGGGLVFPKPGTSGANTVWELRGIVSNTVAKQDACDPSYYVIFTDVAKYLDWIKDNIKS